MTDIDKKQSLEANINETSKKRRSSSKKRLGEAIPEEVNKTISILSEGQLIASQYRILEQIGTGGMGVVYRARDEELDRIVAIKTLPPDMAKNSAAVKRLKKEALSVIDLHHPNIMALYQFVSEDDSGYLIMECLDGPDLDEALADKDKFTVDEMIDVATQVCSALDYAHKRGIVHRDIKPGNLLFTSEGGEQVVKIADFGIAYQVRNSIAKLTGQDTSGGTMHYMPPEQLAGKKINAQADQYALAASLYELLEGRPPFDGSGLMLMGQIKDSIPETIEDVPDSVNSAIQKALSKKPEDRFDNCSQFLESLKQQPLSTNSALSGTMKEAHSDGSASDTSGQATPQEPLQEQIVEEEPVVPEGPVEDRTSKGGRAVFVIIWLLVLLIGDYSFGFLGLFEGLESYGNKEPVVIGGHRGVPIATATHVSPIPKVVTAIPGSPSLKASTPTPVSPTVKVSPISQAHAAIQVSPAVATVEERVKVIVLTSPGIAKVSCYQKILRRDTSFNKTGESPFVFYLTPGEYHFVVKAEGYRDWNSTMKIEYPGPESILAELEKNKAVLSVIAEPSNAIVKLDGVILSRFERLKLEKEPGAYTITVACDGYETMTRKILLLAAKSRTEKVKLSPVQKPRTVAVTITSTPAKATIICSKDGKDIERDQSPCTFNLKPGTYTIEAGKTFYKDTSKTIAVNAASAEPVNFVLAKVMGSISVIPQPANAKVMLDGYILSKEKQKNLKKVPGTYILTVASTGYITRTKKIVINYDEPHSLIIVLDKSEPAAGTSKNISGIKFVWIPAGYFFMGSPLGEVDRAADEGPQHKVTFSKGFWMGKYEVTQSQWQKVMGSNPSKFSGSNEPVEQVSWNDCQNFISKLNNGVSSGRFSLPSESQWEYACRAGSNSPFHTPFTRTITPTQVNYHGGFPYNGASKGTYREKTTVVGSFLPNRWGLHDMHGNVWEWCHDRWHHSYAGAPVDGSSWMGANSLRVFRGGSWASAAKYCRSAIRTGRLPEQKFDYVGLRLVFIP